MSEFVKSLLPAPPPGMRFYPFAGGGVLYFAGARKLWALNTSAAVVWCLLEESANFDELIGRFSAIFSIEENVAQRDVAQVLKTLKNDRVFSPEIYIQKPEDFEHWKIATSGNKFTLPSTVHSKRFFRLADHLFEINSNDDNLLDEFWHYIRHLETDIPERASTQITISSQSIKDKWDILYNDYGYMSDLKEREIIPYLMTLIFLVISNGLHSRLLFHSAVLERNGGAIMLPGESGSGKTTLTAALLFHEFSFYSDELAVLHTDTLQVYELPLPMSIKPGSFQCLQNSFPDLSAFPIYPRADGKKVRYLRPPSENLRRSDHWSCVPVNCLIFPRYSKDSDTKLVLLDKFDALRRLSKTGSSIRIFTPKDVESTMKLIEQKPCYEITYSDVHDAAMTISQQVAVQAAETAETSSPPPRPGG